MPISDAYSAQTLAIGLVVVLFTWKVVGLLRYMREAKSTGLPYVLTPTLETEVCAYVLTPIFRAIYNEHLLKGEGWPKWCRFMIKNWQFEDCRRAHDEYGDVFLVVSPEGLICYSSDALLSKNVFSRRHTFLKPRDKYKLLEPYGPNVATAEGKTYQFHVRITAAPFNEASGANELVWSETVLQTRHYLDALSKTREGDFRLDANGLTLAVISRAGFGKKVDWTAQSGDTGHNIPQGYRMSFLRAISDTTHYINAILLLPSWLMSMTPLSQATLAHSQLEKYLREMTRKEKDHISLDKNHESEFARGNLLTSVMRASASEEASSTEKDHTEKKKGFTEDEVMGNLFIYLLAGYETTANSIHYGLISLALMPDIQEKVIEEIDRVYLEATKEGRQKLTYADDFDKLEYTYGFMYETFRLFPGVHTITKMVHETTEVEVSSPDGQCKSHMLPPGCRVYLNVPATHYSERYWQAPAKLQPERWLDESTIGATQSQKKVVAADRARQMHGTFMTFSDGSRACLGRKFAQSEYVAFLATLLKEYRIILAPGMDPMRVEKELFWRSAGAVTLSPQEGIHLRLRRR